MGAPQMQPERAGPSGHGVAPGQTAGTYGTIEIGLSIALSTDSQNNVKEYWWSLTPDPALLNKITTGVVDTVIWRLAECWIVNTPGNQQGVCRWDDGAGQPGDTGGVVMDTTGQHPWNSDWGTPTRGSGQDQHAYVLEVQDGGGSAPSPRIKYGYTINFQIGANANKMIPVSLDPEIEMGED